MRLAQSKSDESLISTGVCWFGAKNNHLKTLFWLRLQIFFKTSWMSEYPIGLFILFDDAS